MNLCCSFRLLKISSLKGVVSVGAFREEFRISSLVVIKVVVLVLWPCWRSHFSVETVCGDGFAPHLPSSGHPRLSCSTLGTLNFFAKANEWFSTLTNSSWFQNAHIDLLREGSWPSESLGLQNWRGNQRARWEETLFIFYNSCFSSAPPIFFFLLFFFDEGSLEDLATLKTQLPYLLAKSS